MVPYGGQRINASPELFYFFAIVLVVGGIIAGFADSWTPWPFVAAVVAYLGGRFTKWTDDGDPPPSVPYRRRRRR